MVMVVRSTVFFKGGGPEGGLERQKKKTTTTKKKKKSGLLQLQRLEIGQQALVDCTCGHWAPPSLVTHVPARKENCLRTEGEGGHYRTFAPIVICLGCSKGAVLKLRVA